MLGLVESFVVNEISKVHKRLGNFVQSLNIVHLSRLELSGLEKVPPEDIVC